jgi:uncharacterized protein YbjT (DUF2867 family)
VSNESKLIAVLGATGAQGGGLVRAILDDPSKEFRVRAITRDPNSEKAKALAAQGAEVVAGNLDDAESIRRAFEGAYGVFAVTFYWDHFSPERELAEAHLIAQAAKDAGVQHVIWSTLEDTRKFVPLNDDRMPTLMEKYKVPHFDAKGEANAYFAEAGVPTTYLLTSFYWDNFIHFGMGPAVGPDGRLGITFPMDDKPLPGIAAEDIGRCAFGVFKRPELIDQTVGISGGHLTGQEMADGFAKYWGTEVVYNAVPPEVYRSFGFPGADDIGNMFQFKRDFNDAFTAARSVAFSKELNPALQSYDDWLAEKGDQVPRPV